MNDESKIIENTKSTERISKESAGNILLHVAALLQAKTREEEVEALKKLLREILEYV